MISLDNIPLDPLSKGHLWISHYPGKRGIKNKTLQAEKDLLELKKRKIDVVTSLLERKELAALQVENLFELIKKHKFNIKNYVSELQISGQTDAQPLGRQKT